MQRLQFTASLLLVAFSSFICVVTAAFQGGLTATPYGTTDSTGAVFGFNNRVTPGLYAIIWKNASTQFWWKALGPYGVSCLCLHAAAIGVLLISGRRSASTIRNVFFAIQLVLFPHGVLGLLFGSFVVLDVVTGMADGETFSDGIPLTWIAHGVWFFVSGFILVLSLLCQQNAVRQPEFQVNRT